MQTKCTEWSIPITCQQESILVGYVPPNCHILVAATRWQYQWSVLRWTSLNRSPVMAIRCQGQGWGFHVWCPGVWGQGQRGWVALHNKVQYIRVMVTWNPLWTGMTENVTFLQLCWWAIIIIIIHLVCKQEISRVKKFAQVTHTQNYKKSF